MRGDSDNRFLMKLLLCGVALGLIAAPTIRLAGEISRPHDAPKPLTPTESVKLVRLPSGYQLELVASEPLILEPSGLCWDERGRLFVSELHGYNLEGQFDIEELNKTGQLDHEVRRIQADKRAKEAAVSGTYGTIKLLKDINGDGLMDEAVVFADHLPPVYGICPAPGGIIAACAPDIMFLADRDGDGRAEVQEKLFSGFATGALERGINQPQWGLDHWVYFGRGHGGGTITGPHLSKPVVLGNTDFRIKADGSAIEPITGTTHTFGHAFTADGERFTATTSLPGRYVAPLPWRYLARNPDAAAPATDENAADYKQVFPLAPPHPWRSKRATDPGFSKYYRDRYGAGDSDAGGWFTSGCGPLVYQDVALPAECRGAYFVCEPAQNLIHRAVIQRESASLRLSRWPEEQSSEFLASADPWFHPIHLAHGPDGAIWIVDMYREIIEDYSAIPRYLQQQYGLTNGINHGRIWRLLGNMGTRGNASLPDLSTDLSKLDNGKLAAQVGSPHFWVRQTASRLLVDRAGQASAPELRRISRKAQDTAEILNALYTLDALGVLTTEDVLIALDHKNPAVQRHALRFAEAWLKTDQEVLEAALRLSSSQDAFVLLQLALTLGETQDARAFSTLGQLARLHGNIRWMPHAILSGLQGRAMPMLEQLLRSTNDLSQAQFLLEPLCRSIGARRDEKEVSGSIILLADLPPSRIHALCLRGLQDGLKGAAKVSLTEKSREALNRLISSPDSEVAESARNVNASMTTDPATERLLMSRARAEVADFKAPVEARLAAVGQLSSSDDPVLLSTLTTAWASNTPRVRDAILDSLFLRRARFGLVLDALEQKSIPASALSAFQRVTLLESDQPSIRQRAMKVFAAESKPSEATLDRFKNALQAARDNAHGEQVFRDVCAACHLVRGIGFAVGPDLGAEFQRAEEAILKDILLPNETISPGYSTYVVETASGERFDGVLASEAATSVTLRMPTGVEQVILRKNMVSFQSVLVSLMPEALASTLQPRDVADVIAWLRDARGESLAASPNRVILFDDEPDFVEKLNQGEGKVSLVRGGAFSGGACLAVTPPQRFSPRIPGWEYRITEKPGPGEFRYLRFAWRTQLGEGVMIELASDGRWPEAAHSQRRYFAGKNTTKWEARETSPEPPARWQVVTVDLWKDCGSFTFTGIAPTAMGGTAYFDRIELLRSLEPAPSAFK